MPAQSQIPPASRVPSMIWLIVVAAASFATGGWYFRSRSLPSSAPSDVGRVVAKPISPKSDLPSAAKAEESLPAGATRGEWLAALRAKLATSVEDALRALTEIGKTNPALAIDLAEALGRTDEEKSTWVKNMMQGWCDQDVMAAWKWLGGLSKTRMDQLAGGELTGVVLGSMARKDPNLVVSNLDTLLRNGNLSESVSTPVAVHVGLTALVESGKVELAQKVLEGWAKDPQKLNIEAAAFETVAIELAKTAPSETADWLRRMPVGEERNNAIATFAAVWADKDPKAALQWAEALPESEGQVAALRRTVADMIEKYPNEVSGWLGDYLARAPASPATDTLVASVINGSPTIRANPQTALQWLGLISDPPTRAATEERIALRWGVKDRDAAVAYVWKSTTIPAERKPTLVEQIQTTTEVAE